MRFLSLGALVLVLVLTSGLCLRRNEVSASSSRETLRLTWPSIPAPLSSSPARLVEGNGRATKELAQLLMQTFEFPVMLLSGDDLPAAFVIYNFDVRWEVLAFELGTTVRADLRTTDIPMVKSATVNVRRASPAEVRLVIGRIRSLSPEGLREISVPTIDLGLFRTYVSSDNLIERLLETEQRYKATDVPRATLGRATESSPRPARS